MTHEEHVLSVLVASPEDVADERTRLEEVIREFNTTWSRAFKLRLELIRWETHAYPGAGVDAQDVINRQTPDDYDLFIGIMWCRYGTPTGRAGSGTIEEFQRAKARFDEDPSSVKLMIYFKDEAIPPSSLDPEQLSQVNVFRDSLGDEGILYWRFTSVDQFANLARLHLSHQAQAWMQQYQPSASGATPNEMAEEPVAQAELESEAADMGILDLEDVFQERFEELGGIAERLGMVIDDLGDRMNERTVEMAELPRDSQGNVNRKLARRSIDKAATDLDEHTGRIEAELPLFHDALNAGMGAFIRYCDVSRDLDVDAAEAEQQGQALQALRDLRDTFGEVWGSIGELRESVAGLPRMTSELNRAKRQAVLVIDRLRDELAGGQTLLRESDIALSDLLDNATRTKRSEDDESAEQTP